jgi:hypothetical protein
LLVFGEIIVGLLKSISGIFTARGGKEQAAYQKGLEWGTALGNHIDQFAAQRFDERAVELLAAFDGRLYLACKDPSRDPLVAAREELKAFAEEISQFEREMLESISSNLSAEMAFADKNGLHEVMAALIDMPILAKTEFLAACRASAVV